MKYLLIALVLFATFLFVLPQPEPPQRLPSNSFVIRNVSVFDGHNITENQDVLVKDGQIAKIADKVEIAALPDIDGSGKTLLPGLIDLFFRT